MTNGSRRGAFFAPNSAGLVPEPLARSPWSEEMLHGRLLAGLAARAVERELGDQAFRVVRLTVELFRPPPMKPVVTTTRVARAGGRVRAVDVSIVCAGDEMARASALMLRTGAHPDVQPWSAEEWDVPLPDQLDPPPEPDDAAGWDIRPITPGGFFSAGRKRLWTRDRWELVAGEALSPLVRAALASDLPNPMANSGPGGLPFINADLTLSLRRPPTSEWIGLEVSGHLGQDGVAIGSCTLYDLHGAIGWSSVCAVATETTLGS